jgi:hypothetical protein
MNLKQVIVSALKGPVPEHAIYLIDDRGQVLALINVIDLESITGQALDQVGRGIAVIPKLQRINLPLLNQVVEPLLAIVIVDEVLPGGR